MNKNSISENNYTGKVSIKHFLHIMRAIFILLFTCIFSSMAESGYTQNARVTINKHNTSMKEILKEIEHQTDYLFIYNNEVRDDSKVSVKVKHEAVSEVLYKLLEEKNLDYVMEGNHIVLYSKDSTEKPFLATSGQLQKKTVSGKVTDVNMEPIIGANIVEKGTTNGTISNMNGNFTLLLDSGAVIQISYIGYLPKEISIDGRSQLEIVLEEDTKSLDEVVVVGYGTQKKVSTTSSVAQLKNKDLSVRPTSNMQQSLQGLSPGLMIIDEGGNPGRSSATIRVRGITTLTSTEDGRTIGTNDPLILVDGVEQRLEDINANDIESISILKDAASSSIYGSRAANGVILVTTKRGKAGDINIKYNGFFSLSTPQNTPEHMGLEDYMRYQNMAYINSGANPIYSEEYISEYVNATDRLKYPLPNDYMKQMYRTAPFTDNSVSISGGSEAFKALLSLRHKNEEGVLTSYGNKMSSIRINTDFKKSIFTLNADTDYRYNNSKAPLANVVNYIYHGSQWAVPQFPDGTYGLSKQGNNPMVLNDIDGQSKLRKYYFVGNIKLEAQLSKELKVSAQYSAKVTNNIQKDYSNMYKIYDYFDNSRLLKNKDKNSLTEYRDNSNEQTFTGLINFEKQIGIHNLKSLIGYSQIENRRNYLEGYKEYFYNNDITAISMGSENNRKIDGFDQEWGLKSFFGRVNYDYNSRYLFEANARWDGSSRFTGSGVYAFFPSVSAAWRVTQEKFCSISSKILTDLKIRGSWGKTGNQAIPLYEFYPALISSDYTFSDLVARGYIQQQMSNKELTWETTTQIDIGLDAYLFNGKMELTFDYYKKITDGILLKLPIPGVIGLEEPLQNAGSVQNRGIELMIAWKSSINDINYRVSGNLSVNSNKILDLAGSGPYKTTSSTNPMTIRQEGLPIDSHWGYKTAGLFQTQEEVDNYPTLFANSKPGDVKYLDLNNDGQITPEDMTYLGNTFPKYTFGLNGAINYKGFELYMLWQGTADIDVRLTGALIEMGNQEGFTHKIFTNNVWTPENPNARFPRPIKFDLRNVHSSDRVIFDGSYIRLKTLQLSYNIPTLFSQKAFIKRARVSVSATNLLTFSALNEWNLDPEIPSGRANYYPQTSVYSLGLNLEF